jgi:hypothetical protein
MTTATFLAAWFGAGASLLLVGVKIFEIRLQRRALRTLATTLQAIAQADRV